MSDERTPTGLLMKALPQRLDTRMVRCRDMVHLRECRIVARIYVNPWRWAEGRSVEEIATARENGLKFCRVCDPLADRVNGHGHEFIVVGCEECELLLDQIVPRTEGV